MNYELIIMDFVFCSLLFEIFFFVQQNIESLISCRDLKDKMRIVFLFKVEMVFDWIGPTW